MLKATELSQTFARRKGRPLRQQAETLFNKWMPKLSVSTETSIQDITSLFETPVDETWLEIGFGGGEHLAAQIKENPHVGFIGGEPFINGVARLLTLVDEANFSRLRLIGDDVRLLIQKLPDHSLDRVFILFPDPWPKARHHKRRIIQKELLDALDQKMKPGSILRIASDDHKYVEHILETLHSHPAFDQILGPRDMNISTWPERPPEWPHTRYEAKAMAKGTPCAYMEFRHVEHA